MLRSLVGSEMCIRDRVSTQSTGNIASGRMLVTIPLRRLLCTSPARVKQLRNVAAADFKDLGVGGHHQVLSELKRRVFSSRQLSPELFHKLGMRHVKGVLLHGPPGTGKTLVARSLAKLLSARPPKFVNGPEIFRSWVGESESNVRELFKNAQADHRRLKERSPLHVIVFDEIDAICRSRGGGSGGESSNAAVFDSVVSQVLTMLDGLSSCNNVLVIGITNRPELLDSALLRPGRLEVHLEVGLPSLEERIEILELHCGSLSTNGFLQADLQPIASQAANFTGAELESVVLNATSMALEEATVVAGDDVEVENFCVRSEHLQAALESCKPAHGGGLGWRDQAAEWLPLGAALYLSLIHI
eukprot:TRINITY_DN45533_c0_g1_i1.p1 TRINITY_DN45533_c0_g1~~TRINITY_DN45533_c0_g1_i1.p1  ORF type:complete len:385 (+),score=100.95 TRINITY_DN45533_c0_g1_i1:80-1156(+)